MFKNLLSRIQEDDNPRLHRIPFMVIWIAAYGMAWFSATFATVILGDVLDGFFSDATFWLAGIILGLVFGVMLSLIQAWIMRRRYGFVPRFWRVATILGATIGTTIFFTILTNDRDGSDSALWLSGFAWFSIVTLFQAMVMFRVNRQSWLIAAMGILAGIVAVAMAIPDFGNGVGIIWALLLGSAIQAIGTGFVTLRLMANPREGIVPKRDSDEKAKTPVRTGLHSFTFIGFWAAAYFMGWVMLMIMMVIWFLTVGETDIMRDLTRFLENNAEWVFGVIFGSIIGFVSAVAQPWLMKQHSQTEVRHWIAFSTVGWAIAGIGLYFYMDNYSLSDFDRLVALGVWFIVPALFQTIPMWRAMRGGWLWIGTGIVTAIVAMLIETQFDWTYNETFYAIMFGGIAQAIITGTAFIMLKSQQVQTEQQAEVISA